MKKPSYDLGVQLNRNWVGLMDKLNHDGAVRLNEKFDRVHAIANGDMHAESGQDSILEFAGTIDIAATAKKFVVADWFVVDTGERAAVKISYLSDEFKRRFLGKIEDPYPEITLRYHKLLKNSFDIDIIGALGGVKKCEIGLAQIYAFLKKLGDEDIGAKVFWPRDINGELCAVDVYWHGDGRYLRGYSVGHPHGWYGGYLVFSSNSDS